MNKQSVLFTFIGLLIGFVAGFFLANNINRSAVLQPTVSPNPATAGAPNNPQTPSVSIKEQQPNAPMMPEIQQTLDRAEKEPDNFQAQIRAGEIYLKIQNVEKANEFLSRATAVARQDNFQETATLGNGYFDVKNYPEAEKWYSLALAKNPDDVDVRTDLGSTFMERANPDLDRAVKEYRTSLEKNPSHENTLFNLSLALMRKGDAAGAQAELARLEKTNPQSPLVPRLKDKLSQPPTK